MPADPPFDTSDCETLPLDEEGRDTDEDRRLVTMEHPDRYASGMAELGRGAIGRVLVAFDRHLGREVAIKELLTEGHTAFGSTEDPFDKTTAVAMRFLREARITGQLDHPNIVPVYELGERADGTLYYTMKVVRGRTLADAIHAATDFEARLRLLNHFVDLCQAIAYAHSRGVVHRDIKPQNVMVGAFGETVVLDWGIAKIQGRRDIRARELARQVKAVVDETLTVHGMRLGTPAYMSPEQAMGLIDAIDERSDVYSLGAVLRVILTGYPEQEMVVGANLDDSTETVSGGAAPPKRRLMELPIPPEAPPELVCICTKALQPDKSHRYQHAEQLADEVDAYLAGRRVEAYHYGIGALVRRFVVRHRLVVALSGAFVLALTVVAIVGYARVVMERNVALAAEKLARLAEETERNRRAEAQSEGARAAMHAGDILEARAKLRGSFEASDSLAARSLWHNVVHDPLIWKKPVGAAPYTVDFSPDGRWIVGSFSDGSVVVYDATTRAIHRVLRGLGDQATHVAFSPDSRCVAAGAWSGAALLWDLDSAAPRPLKAKHAAGIHGLAFSPDGSLVATGSDDKTIHISRTDDGSLVRKLTGHQDAIHGLSFHPDGKLLASGSDDRTIRLWALPAGTERKRLEGHTGAVKNVRFRRDGKLLASSSHDGTIRLWDASTWSTTRVLKGHEGAVYGLDFHHDGKHIASSSFDNTIRVWEVASGTQIWMADHGGSVRSIRYAPSGTQLASGGNDNSVRLWDTAVSAVSTQEKGHDGAPNRVAFSPDSNTLVSIGGEENSLRVWDVASGMLQQVLRGHTGMVFGVDVSPDGRWAATASNDKSVRVWDLRAGKLEQTLLGHTSTVYAVEFAPGGKRLASGGSDRSVFLWDVASGKRVLSLQGHEGTIVGLDFSPDGKLIATACSDRLVRTWDATTGALRKTFRGHEGTIWGVRFLPNGNKLVSSAEDGTVREWNLATGRGRVVLQHKPRVYWLDVHPDGNRVGLPRSTPSVWIMTLSNGQHTTLEGHRGEVTAVAFSPDGKWAATASDDETVRVWDASLSQPHWRAPGLVTSPLRFCSHRGWSQVDGDTTPHAPSRAWERAVMDRALSAAPLPPPATLLCVATHDEKLELWDTANDKRVHQESSQVEQLLAIAPGCVTRASKAVRLVDLEGESHTLFDGATSVMGPTDDGVAVIADTAAFGLDKEKGKVWTVPVGGGATALAAMSTHLFVGYEEGNVERLDIGSGERVSFALQDLPASAVQLIRFGSRDTLIVGFANGVVGLWSLRSGRRLLHARLHGSVAHVATEGNRMVALSALGDHVVWDLESIQAEYCALLSEIWKSVPVTWANGRAIVTPPPEDHECASSLAERDSGLSVD